MDNIPYKIHLSEEELPRAWYNLKADMPEQHDPFLNPATGAPCTREDLQRVFCTEVVDQEFNHTDRFIPIPDEVRDFYKMYRPSPMVRAYCLEKKLGTPAHIYYKFEGGNTSGSHKLNSAAPQVYYAKKQGLKGVSTETGAGQWGTALSMACAFYELPLEVFMVKVSAQQKPYRKAVMETYGARVHASPSDETEAGRKILAEHPDTGGSLGCAISEAVEYAVTHDGYRYVLGSVLDHVLLHQSVIGMEAKAALDKYGVYPDVVIGCAGGGSNLGGIAAPYLGDKLTGRGNPRVVAVEPLSCPSLSRGRYVYDFGDTACITPLMRMYTLGSSFIPSASHSGGLRYHGLSPVLSKLYHDGVLEARAVPQTDVFDAALAFARCEGILPAPESGHAIRAAIDEALRCKREGKHENIVFCLSGTGYFDMTAYDRYNRGELTDRAPTDEELAAGFAKLPEIR
ncbi:MAG: TrpB-like pyridoxal phosphate-dependent enzyme [Clostridia bacterium]|nr:TrpB-like pyridoxal phosphate-dependent enzyme [Clostridia bacterium]